MMKSLSWPMAVACLPLFLSACGGMSARISGGGMARAEDLVVKSYAVESAQTRDAMLGSAASMLQGLREDCGGGGKDRCPARLYAMISFCQISIGNFTAAREANIRARALDAGDAYALANEARIVLKEKGKAGMPGAMELLKKAGEPGRDMPYVQLTLGDAYFLAGDYGGARGCYTRVLKVNRGFQVAAADRLETIFQIESLNINPAGMSDLIFSKGIRRDEAAYLLDKVFPVRPYIPVKSPLPAEFSDLNESAYADSVKALRELGMFSYVMGDKFEPRKVVTRREMARIAEDLLVLSTRNTGFRSKYGKDSASVFRDVKGDDPFFNAMMFAEERNVINKYLNGDYAPELPMKGLDAMIAVRNMLKNAGGR